METDYESGGLDGRVRSFIDYSFDEAKDGDVVEFDRFVMELLSRYYKLVGKTMPKARYEKITLKAPGGNSGPWEFQGHEFKNDPKQIYKLISGIMHDIRQTAPEVKNAQEGIDWLNNSIQPYHVLFQSIDSDKVSTDTKSLFARIQKNF